ncbi:RING-H2 finger protein ATL3-like [Lycium barbarum]|uniref:RING-H2 finger protein ATL3-like n=1 Tax=Lycium barbarum TaxID=112863 RepID=UPI00293E4206|nr:RING-H2 finger protein ATL3-like [Lycium barbarum]
MGSGKLGDSGMIALIAKIMMAVIMFLFLVVLLVFFLHLYEKFFGRHRQEDDGTRRRRRRRLDFAGGYQEMNARRRGLDPSILKTIPIIPFNTKDFKDGLECSVCLSEVSEGEKTRLLPKCNHGFHVDCIDMWFQSHSTCPLCRNTVESNSEAISAPVEEGSASTEMRNVPTNVFFWGDESTTSTTTSTASTSNRPDGSLVIEIPRLASTEGEEDQKTPTLTRLRSLTRLLSRVNPCSPRNVDIEQGSRGQS